MATLALPVNIIYTVGCAFVSLIVLFLNPIIISVIYNDRQLRRQPSIIYIVNLALVDLCFAAVTFMTTLFRFLHLMTLYPLCLLLHLYLPFSLITASLLLMFTNSVDRFIFIRMSLKYHSIMNSKIAKRVALGIWTYSAAFPLLPYLICDQFWLYGSCGEITSTDTYRYLHIPLQATFFITIVFTILMFISVFRVVKNSRRLRHGPTRSSSMDSLSTAMSSPTLNTLTPSLPPILEIIPYEHDQGSEVDVSPTERSCAGTGFKLRRRRTESEQCCLPRPTDIMSAHTCLSASKDDTMVHANMLRTGESASLNANLPGTRDVTVHASLQTDKALPDLIMSQLWLDDATVNVPQERDNAAIDSVSELLFADIRADLINKSPAVTEVSNIYAAGRSSITPDLVIKSLEVLMESDDMITESCDEVRPWAMNTTGAVQPGPRSDFERESPDMSLVAMTAKEITASDMPASFNLAIEHPAMIVPSLGHGLPQAVNNTLNVSIQNRKHEHSLEWNQKGSKCQVCRKLNTFFKSQGYRLKSDSWRHSYHVKMKSTLPREPLEMLNFKLDQWGSSEITTNSHPREDETSFFSTVTATRMSVRSSQATRGTPATYLLTSTRPNMLQLTARPPMRARRRSLSTSDNSSTVSVDSSSSFSHVTTESTITSDGATSGLQTNNDTTSSALADPNSHDLRATAPQKTVIGCFSDPVPDSNPWPARNLPQRPRVLSVRDVRLSTRRPPLLRRLSSHNHDHATERPRRQPTSPGRTYSRSSSTLTTSSTSSVPFGFSSYSGRDIRTLKILFLMFCVYIMLWLPAFVIQVLRYLDYDISIEITLIVYTLGISNSVFNFFVYPMRIPKLRISFQKLFKSAIADAKRSVNRCTLVMKGK